MKMFLDDERFPIGDDWFICRSFDEAVHFINRNGCPDFISFDHDLGDDSFSGYEFARWLVDQDLDQGGFIPSNFQFYVHSQNPVGAENIRKYLSNYLRVRC